MAVPFSNTKLRVPKGFQNILEGLAREILRSQPKDLFEFGAAHFEQLMKVREETGHDPAIHGAKLEDRFYNNDSFKNPSVDVSDPQHQAAAVTIQSGFRQHEAQEQAAQLQAEKKAAEEEEVDIDLNDPEVADAACKIQAGFRGYKARKDVQEKVASKSAAEPTPSEDKPADDDPELADIDLNDPELDKAATKIQAGFRGHKARKQLPNKTEEVKEDGVTGEVSKEAEEEEIDIDLNDPEVAQAATKIQASFRGHKARQEIKGKQGTDQPENVESNEDEKIVNIDLNDAEATEAATKIQAGFRGHKVRQELKAIQDTTPVEESEVTEETPAEVVEETAAIEEETAATEEETTVVAEDETPATEETPVQKAVEEEIDIDLDDPETEKAALKIQAGFRGYKSRKDAKTTDQSAEIEAAEGEPAAAEPEPDTKPGEEEIDIDLDDPEVAAAATKIQASFRGHKTRQEMKTSKQDSQAEVGDSTADQDNPSEDSPKDEPSDDPPADS